MNPTLVRILLVLALALLAGFFTVGAIRAGAPAALVGALGMFAAGAAAAAILDATAARPRPPVRQVRP